MNDKTSNSPAFPYQWTEIHKGSPISKIEPGLSILDYLAAKAMQGYIETNGMPADQQTRANTAKTSYLMAAAMLEERQKHL